MECGGDWRTGLYCRMSTQMSANITTPSSGVFQHITTRRNILSHVGYYQAGQLSIFSSIDFQLVNKSLPWDYAFRFVIEEISNINDKAQTMSISMYDFDILLLLLHIYQASALQVLRSLLVRAKTENQQISFRVD